MCHPLVSRSLRVLGFWKGSVASRSPALTFGQLAENNAIPGGHWCLVLVLSLEEAAAVARDDQQRRWRVRHAVQLQGIDAVGGGVTGRGGDHCCSCCRRSRRLCCGAAAYFDNETAFNDGAEDALFRLLKPLGFAQFLNGDAAAEGGAHHAGLLRVRCQGVQAMELLLLQRRRPVGGGRAGRRL